MVKTYYTLTLDGDEPAPVVTWYDPIERLYHAYLRDDPRAANGSGYDVREALRDLETDLSYA